MTTLSKEDVVRVDNDLLAMIQKHFPSLPLDDRYTDWGKWLGFAKAVYSHGEQAARADLVAENERLKKQLRQQAEAIASTINKHHTALAAAESDNERLRKFVGEVAKQTPEKPDYWSSCSQCEHNSSEAEDLVAQPRDDSALRKMIAEVYEECAKVCENSDRYRGDYFAAKIRELAEKAKA